MRKIYILAGLICLLLLVPQGYTADYNWISEANSFYNLPTNWKPAAVPGPTDDVIFDLGLSTFHQVVIDAPRTNSYAYVKNDAITFFLLPGVVYTLTYVEGLRVGSWDLLSSAKLTIQNGTVNTDQHCVVDSPWYAKLILNNTELNVGDDFSIGSNYSGSAELSNNATASGISLSIAGGAHSVASLQVD